MAVNISNTFGNFRTLSWWKNRIQFLIYLMKLTLLFTLWKKLWSLGKNDKFCSLTKNFLSIVEVKWTFSVVVDSFRTSSRWVFLFSNLDLETPLVLGKMRLFYSRNSNLPLAISKFGFNPGICLKSNTRFMARKQ